MQFLLLQWITGRDEGSRLGIAIADLTGMKHAKKPSQAIRYLLSVDRRLQRISLKKMSARLTKAKHSVRPARSRKPSGPQYSSFLPWASSRVMVTAMTLVIVAAALLLARQPSAQGDGVQMEPPREESAPQKNVSAAAARQTENADVAPPRTTIASASALAMQPPNAESAPAATREDSATKPGQEIENAVTITGCLEQDAGTFWLKDTAGVDAPKTRSWRSGFLKKRQPRIELVDAANTLRLGTHVGERVAATGVLEDREMRARSLGRVAASCG